MADKAYDLAKEISLCPRNAGGRRHYNEHLRVRVTEFVQTECAQGRELGPVCRQLGLAAGIVRRWLKHSASQGFARVEVVGPVPAEEFTARDIAVREGGEQRLGLTSPSGWRLDGLDLEAAFVLLGRLA